MADTPPKQKRAALIFCFTDSTDGQEQRAGLTHDLASAIPILAELIQDSPTDTRTEYRYREEVTRDVVFFYLKLVSARSKETELPEPENFDSLKWKHLFWLAFRLEDTQFFSEDNFEFLPELDAVSDLLLEMPRPALLHYFGAYLAHCFMVDCTCDRQRVRLLRKEARSWLETLDPKTRSKYERTPLSGKFRKIKKTLSHSYDLDELNRTTWESKNANDLESGSIFNWYDLDMEIKVHLVHLQINLPACSCKVDFFEHWNTFCTLSPSIASYIWQNMKRDELAKYIKTSDSKKVGTALRKESFDDLVAYVEFCEGC